MRIQVAGYIRDKLMNSSIRTKMILVNCTIISVVALLIGAASYILYQQTLTSRLATVNLRDINQVAASMDNIQNNIEELSSFIASDNILQRTICYTPEELDSNSNDQNYVRYMINNMLVSIDYLNFISIYADNGFSYYVSSDKSSNIPNFQSIKEKELYKEALSAKGAPLWTFMSKSDTDYIINNKSDKILMHRTLLKRNDYSTKAFMMISINLSGARELYHNLMEIDRSTIIFLNERNEPFLYDTKIKDGFDLNDMMNDMPKSMKTKKEGTEIYSYIGEKQLLTFTGLKCGWKLLNVAPVRSYAINLQYVPVIVILVFLFALILGFYCTAFTSKLLTKPIKNLVNSVNQVRKGNFKETVNIKYHDEIGELCLDYNEMITHINNLLNQVYALEIEERIAELKALQAQINPHFLYNTLDTIYWKAVANENKGVQEMIHALSKLFRLALNVGNEFFYVSQEKEFIGYYILLQQKRYRNKLQYNIDFGSNILYYQIPKLILQPFVENAIVHGIEKADKQTTIDVIGFMDGDRIHFIIKDDGAGMPEPVLEKLLDPDIDNSSPEKGGYGIKNVINRLSIYYGKDYSLNIVSKLGEGTQISIILPASSDFNTKGSLDHHV